MIKLTTPTVPFATTKQTLEGKDYIFTWEWNMRLGWMLGLADQNGDVIFQPKRLVPNWDLLYVCTDSRRPRGVLMCMDMTATPVPPSFESLGIEHAVIYFEEQEVEEMTSAVS